MRKLSTLLCVLTTSQATEVCYDESNHDTNVFSFSRKAKKNSWESKKIYGIELKKETESNQMNQSALGLLLQANKTLEEMADDLIDTNDGADH
jgi:AICAR transformylase/IMP cyclohydrolase PurH